MNDRVDATAATIFAVGAGSVAAIIFGSVPFSVLDQHAFAYAVMSLTMGVITTAAFFALIEFVLVPIADKLHFMRWQRSERAAAKRRERALRSWSVTRDQR
jgi:hypothetical protein